MTGKIVNETKEWNKLFKTCCLYSLNQAILVEDTEKGMNIYSKD